MALRVVEGVQIRYFSCDLSNLSNGEDVLWSFMDLKKALWKVLCLYGVVARGPEFLCWQQSMCQKRERIECFVPIESGAETRFSYAYSAIQSLQR